MTTRPPLPLWARIARLAATIAIAVAFCALLLDFRTLWVPRSPGEFWALVAAVGVLASAVFALGLLLVARTGLQSLEIAKGDILTRGERDSRECSIRCCKEFADEIIPMLFRLREKLHANNVPFFVKSPHEVVFDSPGENDRLADARAWITALDTGLQNDCIAVLNRFEGWGMYFTKRLADQSTAFEACAPVYIETVIQLYPAIVAMRSQPTSGKYRNVVQLFNAWYGAKENETHAENIKKMEKLVARMKEAQENGQRAPLDPVLGTEPFQ